MLQRMGRTGRKRAGRVVLLLMKGKEEASFAKANDNYEKMQRMISDGTRFKFHSELSARIMPKDIKPEVDKRIVEIPIENTQDASLPEPHRRAKKKTKMPKKRFNMPDDVETGFQPLSKLWGAQAAKAPKPKKPANRELDSENLVVRPPLEKVLLDEFDERLLKDRYQTIAGDEDFELEGGMPNMTNWPEYQRRLRPTSKVNHGAATKRMVKMIKSVRDVEEHLCAWESETAPALNPPAYGDEDEAPKETYGSAEDESDASIVDIGDVEQIAPRPAARKRASNGAFTRRPARKTAKPRTKTASKRRRASRGTSIDLDSSSEAGSDSRDEDDEVDSELEDFVVPDDAPTPSFLPSSTVRKSLSASISKKKADMGEKRKEVVKEPEPTQSRPPRFFEPTHFPGTQGTEGDDDMPEIGTLLGKRKQPSGKENRSVKEKERMVDVVHLSSDNEVDAKGKDVKKKRKARPLIEDSDEEWGVIGCNS